MTIDQFNKCVDLYADGVFRFIYKNNKNKDDAQDVVQNAFEILWKNHEKVEFEKCKSYLFTVAYHQMIDMIRKNKKIIHVNEIDENSAVVEKQYSGIREILNMGLEKLPKIQRSVIMLRDYEGYAYDEIATITNLNESQVKVYIHRARKFLKNYIGSLEKVL